MKVTILLTDIADIAATVRDAEAAGYRIGTIAPDIGVIAAEGPESGIERLRDLPGVMAAYEAVSASMLPVSRLPR